MLEQPGFRRALLLAIVFAVAFVVVSTTGPGLGALLMAVLPLAGLVIAPYLVSRWAVAAGIRGAGGGSFGSSRTAREELGGRYARGEIGHDEYERVRLGLETP